MSSSTQAFDDPGGDDGFFKLESNSVTNYINWYKQPPPNADNAQSIHDWQQQFRHPRDARVYLVFKNPSRTGNQNDRLRANQNGYTVSFVIIGGTTYPRFSLRLGLVHPSNDRFQNVSLRLVFPVYGDDGLNQPRDRLTVTPGRAIENGLTNSLSPDKAFTLSNSMINLAYERIVISKEQSQVSGLKEGANSEMISWQTDIEPISSNFNVNLAALGFTAEQCAVAATFRKLKAPETTIWVRTTIPSNLDWQFKLVTAMPSPCLPPFPLIDARYNPGLKCLKPIHVGNIPSITSEDAAQVRFHLGLRKKGWNKPNGYTGSLVSGPQEKKIISMEYSKFFDGKRHYEAVQILGLAREIQAQRPDAASLFNRQYAFLLSPVPNSFDDSEFVIFLNVRPTHRDRFDATMAPPEPGCAVSITMEQGTQPEPEPSQFRRIHSRAASNASQQRPHASSSASQRSHTRNVSSMSGPAGGPASPASIAQRSHLRNVSNTSVLGGAVSPPGTPPHWDIGSPVRSQPGTPTRVSPSQSRRISDLPLPNISALALSSNVPGDISTWYGPSINRSADMVTWNGFVVPNPSKNRDDFDICIWLRIPSAAEPMGGLVTDIKSGHFKFGITNTGAYVQQEQAIRLAMHGDMSFYGIPPNNWMQDLLLGLENQSLKDQGRGITLKDGPRMHSSFQNKLTNQQKRALQAAVTNNEAKRQKANHYAVLLKGPPGTGKSTVSQCIAYHCYMFGEALLVACGTNRALDSVANKILEILPKSGSQWTVPNSVKNVYRLETDFDESYEQVSRNGQAYSHTFSGDYEPRSYQIDLSQYRDAPIDDNNFRYLEEYVKRRATTNRPLSLGDHILQRLRKARAQRLRAQWTFDEYPPEESKREYDLLNDFIGLRHAAARQNVFYVEIIGETAPQRRARFEELDDTQKFITKETAKAWRNLQTFYIKHARIILITAQTAGRRIMKGFRASRVIIEEAGQLDEPNSLNAFVRSYSTLRKVIWSGDPDQLPPTVLSANMNEAEANFRTSQMDRLAQTGVEVIELDQQFRMHSHIGDFISGEFYGNRVRNATGTDTAPECAMFRDWVKAYAAKHGKNIQTPANSFFISVEGTKIFRRKQATSSCNPAYIERAHDVVMDLLRHTARTKNVEHIQQLRGKCHIAMVCYYAEELALLKKWLHGVENLADIVDVVTVDSTQGWEWDFVILSTTRPGGSYGLGFVADRKRQNVALSRAKYGQVTIGHKNMGRRFATTEGQRGSVGGTGFAGWENYWKYHVNHLNCCLEVQGSIQQVLQALNVDQNNYEEVPEGRH